MKALKHSFGLFLLFVLAGMAPAEESSDPVYLLLDKALRVKVTARVFGEDEALVWDMESTYVTISGRTVSIPLKGSNVVMLVHVTPYTEPDGEVLLVAEGQVWLTPSGSEEVKYLSTLKSIPIRLGEKILFFPLGMDMTKADETQKDSNGTRSVSDLIELQVQILPYQDSAEQPTG